MSLDGGGGHLERAVADPSEVLNKLLQHLALPRPWWVAKVISDGTNVGFDA